MKPTTISQNCIDVVKYFEGKGDGDKSSPGLQPYMDPVGIWTIGYGHALRDDRGIFLREREDAARAKAQFPNGITEQEAEDMLRDQLMDVRDKFEAHEVRGTQGQMDAFTSFAYNLGLGKYGSRGGLLGSTLIMLHRNSGTTIQGPIDDYKLRQLASRSQRRVISTIAEGFGAYSFAGGKWYLGLFRRRMAEYMLYRGDSAQTAINAVARFRT